MYSFVCQSRSSSSKKGRRGSRAPSRGGGAPNHRVPAKYQEPAKPTPKSKPVSTLKKRQKETRAKIKAMGSSPQVRAARSRQSLSKARQSAAAAGLLKKAKHHYHYGKPPSTKRSVSPGLQRLQQEAASRGKFGNRGRGRGRGKGRKSTKNSKNRPRSDSKTKRTQAETNAIARQQAAARAAGKAKAAAKARRLEETASNEHHRRESSGGATLARQMQELEEAQLDRLAKKVNAKFTTHLHHDAPSSGEIQWSPPHSSHGSKSSSEIHWSPPHSTHTSKSSNEIKWSPPTSGEHDLLAAEAAEPVTVSEEPPPTSRRRAATGELQLDTPPEPPKEDVSRQRVPVPKKPPSPARSHHRKHSSLGSGDDMDFLLRRGFDSDSSPESSPLHRRNASMGSIASMDSMDSVEIMARMQMEADGTLPKSRNRRHHRYNSSIGSLASIESMNSAGELELMAKMQKEAGVASDSCSGDADGSDTGSDSDSDEKPTAKATSPSFKFNNEFGHGAGVFQRGGIGTGSAAPGFTPRFSPASKRGGFAGAGNAAQIYGTTDASRDPVHHKKESSGGMSDDFAQYMSTAASREEERAAASRRAAAVSAANAKQLAMRRAQEQEKLRQEAALEEDRRRREAATKASPPPIRRVPSGPRSIRGRNSPNGEAQKPPHHRQTLTPSTPATPPHRQLKLQTNYSPTSSPDSSVSPLARQAADKAMRRAASARMNTQDGTSPQSAPKSNASPQPKNEARSPKIKRASSSPASAKVTKGTRGSPARGRGSGRGRGRGRGRSRGRSRGASRGAKSRGRGRASKAGTRPGHGAGSSPPKSLKGGRSSTQSSAGSASLSAGDKHAKAPGDAAATSRDDSLATQLAEAKAAKMAQIRKKEQELQQQMEQHMKRTGSSTSNTAGPGGPGVSSPPADRDGMARKKSIRGGRSPKVETAAASSSPPTSIDTSRAPAVKRIISETKISSLSSPPQKTSRSLVRGASEGPGSPGLKLGSSGPGGDGIKDPRMLNANGPRSIRGRRSSHGGGSKSPSASVTKPTGTEDTGDSSDAASGLVSALMDSVETDTTSSKSSQDPPMAPAAEVSASAPKRAEEDDGESESIRASAVWSTTPRAPPKGKRRVSIRGGMRSPKP